jgi:DNA repair photolyase
MPATLAQQLELLGGDRPGAPSGGAALPVLDSRERGTTFHEVPVKAILNSPAATGMGFWSLNPYVGCEFGCTYCYARETHKWTVERETARHPGSSGTGDAATSPADAFEHQILVKTTAAAVLKRTLFPKRLAGQALVIGTATDPYQPAERRFRLTRSLLEVLLGWRGLSLGITTKSPLVVRDLDLLTQLAERHELSVNISIASADPVLLRRLEARSPAPHARLRALARLRAAGIHAGLLIAPILPGITDSREALSALMAAGKAAGACYAIGMPLRLGPAARSRFLPHLEHEFPELVPRYARRYGTRHSAGPDYVEALAARIRALQQEHGFPVSRSRRRERALKGQAPRGRDRVPVEEQWTLL